MQQQQQQQQTRQIFKEAYRGCSESISVREKAIRARLMVAPFKAKLGSRGRHEGGVARCCMRPAYFLPIPILYRVQSTVWQPYLGLNLCAATREGFNQNVPISQSQTLAKMQAKIYIDSAPKQIRTQLHLHCLLQLQLQLQLRLRLRLHLQLQLQRQLSQNVHRTLARHVATQSPRPV